MDDEQRDYSAVPKNLQPHVYKKGQSGNPAGRPVGAVSMKTYVKNKLASMTEEEREEFLEGVDKKILWEMAEGKPKQDTEVSGSVALKVIVPPEVARAFNIDATNTQASGSDTEQV